MTADAALTKMRLMALLMLGSKAAGSPVPFTDIQAALDITPEQVGGNLSSCLVGFGQSATGNCPRSSSSQSSTFAAARGSCKQTPSFWPYQARQGVPRLGIKAERHRSSRLFRRMALGVGAVGQVAFQTLPMSCYALLLPHIHLWGMLAIVCIACCARRVDTRSCTGRVKLTLMLPLVCCCC